MLRPTTPREPKPSRFGLFRVRSPLLTESLICFLFLRVLRWFTSPGSLLPAYVFSGGSRNLPCEGLPHSEILGSKPVCGSQRLIAACHVLHRFSAPRHPPSTLSSLTIKYLKRESFSFTRLSCQRSRSPRIKKPSEPLSLSESCLIRACPAPDSSIPSGLVELSGLEPPTYGLQSRRSPS